MGSVRTLAVVNPAAGHGRCGKLVGAALDRLRTMGVRFDVARTVRPGHAVELAREGHRSGYERFISVGGDGTSFEIVNGLMPVPEGAPRPVLGFLPLGTGNSFLRDFTDRGIEHSFEALAEDRRRPCDVLRMTHATGVLYYINLLSLGFIADVAVVANRRYKRLGEIGYLLGVLQRLIRPRSQVFPHRLDGRPEPELRPCLFLTFNNSKFTGGKMMIAPQAEVDDGLVEVLHLGPLTRLGLIRNLPKLYDGSHVRLPQATRWAAHRIDFDIGRCVDVMVDGEVQTIECRVLDVLSKAIDVAV